MLDGRTVISDHEGSDRGAADHHQLERESTEDDPELAAGDQIAAEDHPDNDENSDNAAHRCPPLVCFSAARNP